MWAEDVTVTLTQSNLELTGSYTSGTEKTIDGITYVYTDLMKNTDNIQAKASTGVIYNKTAFPQNIKSVAITHSGTARATTIMGSSDGENWTEVATGSGSITGDFTNNSYKYFKITRGSNAAYWTQIVITYESGDVDSRTATTTTIDDTGITNKNKFVGTSAGSLSASVAAGETSIDATVTWSGDNDNVAKINESGVVTLVGAGTVTFTATYAGDDNYKPSTDTYELTVINIDPNTPGTETTPYTVAQARAAIDAGTGVDGVYVKGIVSEIVTAYSSQYGNISYNISADGTTTSDQLLAYRGKSYNGDNFTSANDIQSGDVVVVKGNLINYKGTYEFAEGSQLVSLQRKELSSITLTGNYTTTFVEGSEFNHDGVVVTATYSDNSTADVTDNATFSAPDMTQIGTQTITVTYQEKTATYDITITAAPSHTATFSINGEVSTNDFKENADITFPADPEAISGMQFIGWTDAEISGTTNTAPTNLISTATMGTTDVTYYAVFADVTPGNTKTVTDELTKATTGAEESTYTAWTATGTSGAEYAGQSAGGNSSIQLRSDKSTSGIISTTSAGRVKEVVVEWNTNTADGRTLDIYGNNTAYTKVTELYATGQNSNQGTKLGSIVNGTSTKLTIEGDYAYIGLRSYTGAMYLNKISITWESGTPYIYSNYCTTIPTSIDITVSSVGYKAYNTVMATDFTKTEGLKAFAVTAYSDASVTLNEVETAPAGTPLVLKANGGDYTLYAAEETPAAPANLLLVSNGTVKGDGSTIYALANVDGPGFYVVQEGLTIPTNYIEIPTGSNAPALSFDFGEGTTGIRSIENGQLTIDNVYYDLSGRKLNAMPTQKGVYIVNGKKVVIK